MGKTLIAGNWKMNNTVPESLKLFASLQHNIKNIPDNMDVVIIPPFTSLYNLSVSLQESRIQMGAQDIFWEDTGAYTGEVSGVQLRDVGCKFVLIGHSERRKYLGETDETVNKKVFAALRNELVPIVCVGETIEEREAGKAEEVVETQLKGGLAEIPLRDAANIAIAYEPVWAIGTGRTATAAQAQEMHHFIRSMIEKKFDSPTASKIRIIYGGSVNAANSSSLLTQKDIDGALVGGASLKGSEFADIVRAVPHKNL